jgi:hypothetical protein
MVVDLAEAEDDPADRSVVDEGEKWYLGFWVQGFAELRKIGGFRGGPK